MKLKNKLKAMSPSTWLLILIQKRKTPCISSQIKNQFTTTTTTKNVHGAQTQ